MRQKCNIHDDKKELLKSQAREKRKEVAADFVCGIINGFSLFGRSMMCPMAPPPPSLTRADLFPEYRNETKKY